MKQIAQSLASFFTNKKTYCIFLLFIYFGSTTIPEWFYRFLPLSLVWLLFSIVVAATLILIGVWGIIGFLQSKVSKRQVTSKHVSFVQISVAGLLAFGVSIAIANQTYFFYAHQKFNSGIWQDSNSISHIGEELTQRQRMVDDVVENILPGKNKDEIEALLGKPLYTSRNVQNKFYLNYKVGPEFESTILPTEPQYLLIFFDDSGNFTEYAIIHQAS
jgi:outer membrane protein assembly factor BamE (lipoprotein component of BamABCDE complex)